MPALETFRVETDSPQTQNDELSAGLSCGFKQEAFIAETWSAQDRAAHEQSVREILDRIVGLRHGLEQLHGRTDTLWERFSTLALERVLSGQLREFLDGLEARLQELDQHLVETDCEIDRLRTGVQERLRVLEEKMAVLEPLAHRTTTQSHISMMLSRVEGLEASLLDKKDMAPNPDERHDPRHIAVPGDLLYLRVRLLTTRIAIIASNRSKHLSELHAGLAALLPNVERVKADMATLLTRADCIRDLSRYWLAYLDITQGARSRG